MNIPYRISTYRGRRNRRRFMARVGDLPPLQATDGIAAAVYAFSGESDWPEQMASLRSFLRFAGRPVRFIIVSDGSHGKQTRAALERVDPCVSVVDYGDIARPDLPDAVKQYACTHPLGKKLALLMSIPAGSTSIYMDSDILFFPEATSLRTFVHRSAPLFLSDCSPSFDRRLIAAGQAARPYLNSGFLILKGDLDWMPFCDRLGPIADSPSHFTEQTIVHLAVQAAGGEALPGEKFILQYDDQFGLSDGYARRPGIVLRHYISSIRTKMWHHTGLFS